MTHPTDDSLKPCPFCGSQPEPAPYVLKCVNAYCEAQPSVSGGNDDECATAWNKRALLAEQARTEPHKAEDAPSDAARDVLAERQRQISAEGWTPEHDDEHDGHEMAHAAACYAYPELTALVGVKTWPWAAEWFKVRDHRSNYVRAAALLLAEIERLDRAAIAQERKA